MTIAAAAPSWWADWPKFAPGWLAFLVTTGTLVRKTWTRRRQLALGPEAQELRTQLTEFRALLEEVTSGNCRTDWFLHDERREAARALRDSAERRDDETLKLAMTRMADAWDEIFALAPAPRAKVRFVGDPVREGVRREYALGASSDLERLQKMTDVAHTALIDVEIAVERLNALERSTHGRS
ncbi:hypothetical protein [Streptomyces sp. 142MFCol3.1]|uniref:hypothetical protein n=1 Tax=Streptomyces sp. 142MFCol3.1 TaxID=1172179 RepID=UPI000490A264|nr:hypothetical protein [Streptomyces sp. 142MFCol3.1]